MMCWSTSSRRGRAPGPEALTSAIVLVPRERLTATRTRTGGARMPPLWQPGWLPLQGRRFGARGQILLFYAWRIAFSRGRLNYENGFGVLGWSGHLGVAFVDPGETRRGDDRVLRQHRPGGGTEGPARKGAPDRRGEGLRGGSAGGIRARFYFSDDAGRRDLREPVFSRHQH